MVKNKANKNNEGNTHNIINNKKVLMGTINKISLNHNNR